MTSERAAGNVRRLIRSKIEVAQHVSWMRVYIDTMMDSNWRDNKLRLSRQLDELEKLLNAHA